MKIFSLLYRRWIEKVKEKMVYTRDLDECDVKLESNHRYVYVPRYGIYWKISIIVFQSRWRWSSQMEGGMEGGL